MIWLIADTHFDCRNLVENTRPRFSCVDEHNEYILDQINSKVQRRDRLYIAGDFCKDRPFKWRQAINCKQIFFAIGNHDKPGLTRQCFGTGNVAYQWIVKWAGCKTLIKHTPEAFWEGCHKGWFHAYGHVHGQKEGILDAAFPGRRSCDVGVDCWDYSPVSIETFLNKLADRPGHDIITEERRWNNKDYT